MNLLLTICIPTYNRKDVLINEIIDYLSCNDCRFRVKVNDNYSTDGTREALENIKDPRLLCCFNSENLGSIPNWILSLSNNTSDYLLFVLDKDFVDVKKLPLFLDYLEKERPFFGYIELDLSKSDSIETMEPGFDNILKMAYLDKHPSGYFYRRDLFEKAILKDSYLRIDKKFDFPFEVINAEMALEYSSTIYPSGLIITANLRKDVVEGKTLSYNESNIWYGVPRRCVEYGYYLNNALSLDIPPKLIARLCRIVTETALYNVTVVFRNLMNNDVACNHYNIQKRTVGLMEMSCNAKQIMEIFSNESKKIIVWYKRFLLRIQVLLKCYYRILLHY